MELRKVDTVANELNADYALNDNEYSLDSSEVIPVTERNGMKAILADDQRFDLFVKHCSNGMAP